MNLGMGQYFEIENGGLVVMVRVYEEEEEGRTGESEGKTRKKREMK